MDRKHLPLSLLLASTFAFLTAVEVSMSSTAVAATSTVALSTGGSVVSTGAVIPSSTGAVIPSSTGAVIPSSTGAVIPSSTGAAADGETLSSIAVLSSSTIVASSTGAVIPSSTGAVIPSSTGAVIPSSTGAVIPSSTGADADGETLSSIAVLSPSTMRVASNTGAGGGAVTLSSITVLSSSTRVASSTGAGGDGVILSSTAVLSPSTMRVASSTGAGGGAVTLSSITVLSSSTRVASSTGAVIPSSTTVLSSSTRVASSTGAGGVILSSTTVLSSSTRVASSTGAVIPSSTTVLSPSRRVSSSNGGVAGTPNITVATPSTSVVSVNSIVSTSLSGHMISTPTPTSTRKRSIASSSDTHPKKTTYYQYNMGFTLTGLDEKSNDVNETDVGVLSLLITECQKSYTTGGTIYFQIFQLYIQVEICRLYKHISRECVVRVTKLKCGSITGDYSVTIGVDSSTSNIITNGSGFTAIKQEIKKGKIGVFTAAKSSFSRGEFKKDVIKEIPPKFQPKFEVIVIVTMGYTWKEFCGVAEQFKEQIAERSHSLDGRKLKPNEIYIIDRKKNCDRPDNRYEEIEVKFVVLGEDQDKLTIAVGHDLIDLVESGLTRKLGNLFEGKIKKVEFSGSNAPTVRSGLSDIDKIWLAVGITLGVIFLFIFFYLCCCRQAEQKTDEERFAMDKMDNAERGETVLVNEGFDEHEGTHTPLSQRISTFKAVTENGNEPVTKSNDDEVSAQPSDDDTKLAPLGEGEDTDDELDMTVPDVAIETDGGDHNGSTPPETSPTIPPNPSHMAIKDLAKFLEESGDESQKNKEYENLDKSMTAPETYGIDAQDRNRSDAIVPKPETRVKTPGQNDYINANFVKDHHGKENFIATQHPLSNTMRDFWSMVWDKNVSVIVMVNNEEKDLENFHNYWLDHKNSLTIYGHMQVKTNHAESMSGFKFTKFVLQNSQEVDKTKTVNHFRFVNWSKKGVPDAKEFAEFVRSIERIRLENPSPPVVVHCSEGQGYTGVVLATDIGLRVYNESDKESTIDVFDCVEKMRKDRNGIVCSKELYNFVYQVLSVLTSKIASSDSKL